MPVKDTTILYNANSNGSAPVVYSDWFVTGYLNSDYIIISGGNDGDTFIEILWLNPGTYQIEVKATNECSTLVPGVSENIIVTACVPNWTVVPGSNACGQTIATIPVYPQANLDVCKRYNREVDGCGNFRWTETGIDTNCPGCCAMIFNISGPSNNYVSTTGGSRFYQANVVVAGSGDYSYNWNAIETSGNNISSISITPGLLVPNDMRLNTNFNSTGTSTMTITCTITDNVSNCSVVVNYYVTWYISN